MSSRLKNPAMVLPEATKAIHELVEVVQSAGLPEETMGLVHLRASQINGCGGCAVAGAVNAKKAGETDERLFAVSGWRDAPWFTDSERAALALAEATTRLSDRSDPVPDDVWDEAAKYFDEKQLAALVLWIATTNLFNRVNVTTRQPAGRSWG
ncbi:MAG TPA: carboxymuconolactone decarboxylase family protein [Acidimicrobiales bacterium]|jgi:AhpD family alkylhydroperoxidase|nr:carboxymuconolactone decarboxylase family protein [Acidimicrobiales bacterium]